MNGFVYYVSGRTKAYTCRREQFAGWGLAYAFEREVGHRELVGCGPDGQHGIIAADPDVSERGYFPDKQTWRQIPPPLLADDAPPIYVGFNGERPPGPDDLARRHQVRGHWTQLAAGLDKWHCPAAYQISENEGSDDINVLIALPVRSRLGDDGRWTANSVHSDHARLWGIAQQFFDRFYAGKVADGEIRFDFAGVHDAAVVALGTNYRVGPVECEQLEILTEASCIDVLRALVDFPTSREWTQKKTESAAAGSASSPGRAA